MFSNETHIEIQALLHKLRQSQLSDSEWDRLRTLSSEDPFLSEAIEGLQLLPHDELSVRITSIESSLHSLLRKKKKKRPIVIILRRVAAVSILIFGVWMVWRAFPDQDPTMAMLESEQPRELSNQVITPGPVSESAQVQDEQVNVESSKEVDVPQREEPPQQEKQLSSANKTREPAVRKETHTVDKPQMFHSKADKVPESNIAGSELKERNASDEGAFDNEMQEKSLDDSRVVPSQPRSIVPTEQDKANVSMQSAKPKSVEGTGRQELSEPQSVEDYNSATETLQTTMSVGEADSGKLKRGYSNQIPMTKEEKNQGPRNLSYALATPLGGWESYYKYLRKNIAIPQSAIDASIEGTVMLEFDLKKDGSAHNFRITQSLGYGCDEETIRLVREGPKWDVKNAQVAIGGLSVDF